MSNPVSIYSGTFRATIYPEKLRTMTLTKLKKFFKLLDTAWEPENEGAKRVIKDTLSQQVEDVEKELRRAVQSRWANSLPVLDSDKSELALEIRRNNKKLESAVKKAERELKRAQKIMCYFEQIVH